MTYEALLDGAGRFDPDRIEAWMDAQQESGLDRRLSALPFLFGFPDARMPLPEAADGSHVLPPELEWLWRETGDVGRQSEYLRLFVKGLPRPACPPYGSLWLEGELDGVTTGQVRAVYRRHGLDTTEAPDHFAAECQLLGVLRALARRDPANEEDYLLILCHLTAWAGAFLDRVAAQRAPLYREAARFAREVLDQLAAEATGADGAVA